MVRHLNRIILIATSWLCYFLFQTDYPYCRQPGLYSTQKLLAESNTVYKYGEKVSYECNVNPCRQPSCTNERTCTEKGWSGGPPRCVSGNSNMTILATKQIFLILHSPRSRSHVVPRTRTRSKGDCQWGRVRVSSQTNTVSNHWNQCPSHVQGWATTTIANLSIALLTLKFIETKEAVYRDDLCRRNPITDISLESLLPQLNVTWVPPKQVFTFIYTENKYNVKSWTLLLFFC